MKKILLILTIAITSCNNRENECKIITSKPLDYSVNGVKELNVVTIEGCEYFTYKLYGVYDYYAIEHKGNCKNPIHYQNK